MRRGFHFGLMSFVLSFCIGSGFLLLSNHKDATKAVASVNTTAIEKAEYVNISSDPSSMTFNRYLPNNGHDISSTDGVTNYITTNSATNYTYNLNISSNKSFVYFTTVIQISVSQVAYSHGNYNVSFVATSNNTSSGQSDHALEVFALDNYYPIGAFPSQSSFGNFTYNQDDYSTVSSGALFRASGRGGGSASQNNTSSPKSYEVENKNNTQQTYYIIFVVSGYREQSNGNNGYSATVNIQINQTTNIAYGVYNYNENRYHDTLSGALDYINNSASDRTSHTLYLLKDLSETAAGKEMKTGVTLDLQGHNFTYTGSATSAYMIIRQANGLKGAREFKFMSTGGEGKISGNFNDSVLLLGGVTGTYSVNTYIGPGVTIENTGNGKAIASHQTSRLQIDQGATLIANNNFGLYLNVSASSTTNIAGTIISKTTHAVQIQSVTDSGYVSFGGSTLSLRSKSGLASIFSNCSPIDVKIVANCTVANITRTYTSESDPISITFATTPTNGMAIVYQLNADALNNFSVTNESNKYHLEYNSSSGYAFFAINKYNVTFNSNGGSGSMTPRSIEHGSTLTLPANSFTAPSYRTFLKWNTKADGTGTNKNVGETYTITFDIVFYAIWYKSDINSYDEFRIEYLHMNDYTTNQGWCKDSTHHYYSTAKEYFENNMTSLQRTHFANNYADEWARFVAWASANGDEVVYESNDYVVRQSSKVPSIIENYKENPTIYIVIASIAIISSLLLALLIFKRKNKIN